MNFEYRGYKCKAEWDYEYNTWWSGIYPAGTNDMICIGGATPVDFYKDMQDAVESYEEMLRGNA